MSIRRFIPLKIAIFTISDTRTEQDDRSGHYLAQAIQEAGHVLQQKKILSDQLDPLIQNLKTAIRDTQIDVVICTGGTGLTGRDQTPEAFDAVIEKWIPGFGELFRWLSYQKIGTSTIQSRATAGMASGTLLFALPGSPSACRDAWSQILQPQLDNRHRPCNFAEILPRFKEDPNIRREKTAPDQK